MAGVKEGNNVVVTGRLELIFGPMFAGKTSEMLRRIRRQKIAGQRCLLVKYAADARYSQTCVATHDQQSVPAEAVSRLIELSDSIDDYDVIGIDEGQFYPDIHEEVERYLSMGKAVVISALDGTFEQKPFREVLRLISMADRVTKLNAVCMICYENAPFTQRISSDREVEKIGGSELYRPVCRACYDKTNRALKNEPSLTEEVGMKENVPVSDRAKSSKPTGRILKRDTSLPDKSAVERLIDYERSCAASPTSRKRALNVYNPVPVAPFDLSTLED